MADRLCCTIDGTANRFINKRKKEIQNDSLFTSVRYQAFNHFESIRALPIPNRPTPNDWQLVHFSSNITPTSMRFGSVLFTIHLKSTLSQRVLEVNTNGATHVPTKCLRLICQRLSQHLDAMHVFTFRHIFKSAGARWVKCNKHHCCPCAKRTYKCFALHARLYDTMNIFA